MRYIFLTPLIRCMRFSHITAQFISLFLWITLYLVPPLESYFRLSNLQSSRCIYYDKDTDDFNARDCCDEGCRDQVWYINDTTSSNDDYYRIRHSQSDRCIYSTTSEVDAYICNPWPGEYWTFEHNLNPTNDFYFRK